MRKIRGKVSNLTVEITDKYPEKDYGWVDFEFMLGENTIFKSSVKIFKKGERQQIQQVMDDFFTYEQNEKLRKIVDYHTVMALRCLSEYGYSFEYDVILEEQ